jgi:polysaccharide export outer membrane protein
MRPLPLFAFLSKRIPGFYQLILVFCGAALFSSCIVSKTTSYFKTLNKDTTIQGFITNDFESKIQKKDVLGITVSSMNKLMDESFNLTGSAIAGGQSAPGYLVNEKGEITLHYLGTITAAGLTRKELKQKIEQGLLPFMKEPIAGVQYLNHKVTILGEITRPQVINMPEEQMSIIDVIVNSGDVKENASRKNIMVIREEKDTKKVKYINLEDHSIFTSPWYYVQPNDIVYVLPDTEKYMKEEKRRNMQTTFSLVASVVSLVAVILNFIIR